MTRRQKRYLRRMKKREQKRLKAISENLILTMLFLEFIIFFCI